MKLFRLGFLMIIILLFSVFLSFSYDLNSFPYNYISGSNKLFLGNIVVGSDAAQNDMVVAESLQNHLISNFDLIGNKVEILYGKLWQNKNSIHLSQNLDLLNIGENLGNFRDFEINRSYSNDILSDETLKLSSSVDYTQQLVFADNGFYEVVENAKGSKSVINFNEGNVISYELRLKDPIDVSDLLIKDIIGKKLVIMDNEFIIMNGWRSVLNNFASTFEKLKLIRASETYVLSENESELILVGENMYSVKVEKVTSSRVTFLINNRRYNVDLYETDYLGDGSIGLLNTVISYQDNVSKSYAEFVIGDVELLLEDTKEVKINGAFASEVLDGYTLYSTFDSKKGEGWSGLKLTYSIIDEEGLVLDKGKSFDDTLFNVFKIVFVDDNYYEFKDVLDELSDFVYADVVLQLGKRGSYQSSVFVNKDEVAKMADYLDEEGYKILEIKNFTSQGIIYDNNFIIYDSQVENLSNISNVISIGGPAVNRVTAALLNLSYPTYELASGVKFDEGVIKYFEDSNSLVIYGYDEIDTASAVNMLKRGNLTGLIVNTK